MAEQEKPDGELTTQASALATDSEAKLSARSGGISDLNKLRSERQAFKEQMQQKEGQLSQ